MFPSFRSIPQNCVCFLLLLLPVCSLAQTPLGDAAHLDKELLNKFILAEVNKIRKKEKAEPLENKSELLPAAQDQADYMRRKEKLTHFQRFNKYKKTPKNRVDFYGRQFAVVGENVQLNNLRLNAPPNDKKNPPVTTYEKLAQELVTSWKNSPPHFRNMIDPEFKSTYTTISITENGEVYACQLFGGSVFQTAYEEQVDSLNYKPESDRRCSFCKSRVPLGHIELGSDSSIFFVYETPLRWPSFPDSRMRLFNPWNDGLAADIVLKSQYPCDSANYFNGRRGVRGIPLPPVYRKDFHIGVFRTLVYLGKVPNYIKEDFEVNVTVVKNKRTCSNIIYNIIPSSYYVAIPLNFDIEAKELTTTDYIPDTLTASFFFNKGAVEPVDTVMLQTLSVFLQANKAKINQISLEGYASIEGSTETNARLYKQRAEYLSRILVANGIDEKQISLKVNENFADFREDVAGTEFADLAKKTDAELKTALKDQELVKKLEPILAKHRYVHVRITSKDTIHLLVTKEVIQQLFKQALATKNKRAAADLQKAQYACIQKGELHLSDLDSISIPVIEPNKQLLHNLAVIRFLTDTLNPKRYDNLEEALKQVLKLDKTYKSAATSVAILEYYRYCADMLDLSEKQYFRKVKGLKDIDKKIQARILLNFASSTDWMHRRRKKKYYGKVKSYIPNARLDVDKTFELASYYSYFDQNEFAYNLVRNKIDETKDPDDLVYFLKLIQLNDVSISHEKYLSYFEKIRRYSGDQFCSFFNTPNLNFQILDDPDIKKIYCKECAGVLSTGTLEPGK